MFSQQNVQTLVASVLVGIIHKGPPDFETSFDPPPLCPDIYCKNGSLL